MIGLGVQALSERQLGEKFAAVNKKKLFDALRRNEVSNVVLITGDMHNAQFFENDCLSHTGSKLFEVTSSGLSHTAKD